MTPIETDKETFAEIAIYWSNKWEFLGNWFGQEWPLVIFLLVNAFLVSWFGARIGHLYSTVRDRKRQNIETTVELYRRVIDFRTASVSVEATLIHYAEVGVRNEQERNEWQDACQKFQKFGVEIVWMGVICRTYVRPLMRDAMRLSIIHGLIADELDIEPGMNPEQFKNFSNLLDAFAAERVSFGRAVDGHARALG